MIVHVRRREPELVASVLTGPQYAVVRQPKTPRTIAITSRSGVIFGYANAIPCMALTQKQFG